MYTWLQQHRSSSSSSDESDSFDGLSIHFQHYSFEPNVRQRCEDVDSVSRSDNEASTADSEIMDESKTHENTGSKMDIAQQTLSVNYSMLWTQFRKLACYVSNLTIWIGLYFVNSLF